MHIHGATNVSNSFRPYIELNPKYCSLRADTEILLSHRIRRLEVKEAVDLCRREIMLYPRQAIHQFLLNTLSHTNAYADSCGPTLKDVERFRQGLYMNSSKANQLNSKSKGNQLNSSSKANQMNSRTIIQMNSNVDLNVNSTEYCLAKHVYHNLKPDVLIQKCDSNMDKSKGEKTTLKSHQEEHKSEAKMKSILVYILFIFFIVLMLLKIEFFYIKERVLSITLLCFQLEGKKRSSHIHVCHTRCD